MQSNSIRVTIQKATEDNTDPLGEKKVWTDEETYWANKIYIGIDGKQKYQQIGFSDVEFFIRFNQKLNINLSDNRLKIDTDIYEVIDPASVRGLISRDVSKVAVREVVNNGG